MPALSRGELVAAQRFSTVDNLNNDGVYAIQVSDAITSFIDRTDNLVGEAWDAEKANMLFYKDKLEKQKVVAKTLGEAIENALNKLLSEIAPDDYVDIDDASIDDVREQILALEKSIESIESNLSAAKVSSNSQNSSESFDGDSSTDDVSDLESLLSERKYTLEELKKMLKKMEHLRELAQSIEKELATAFDGVKDLYSEIAGTTRV